MTTLKVESLILKTNCSHFQATSIAAGSNWSKYQEYQLLRHFRTKTVVIFDNMSTFGKNIPSVSFHSDFG